MESYYEINVSCNGKHYFATAPRSLKSKGAAWEAHADFVKRFPEAEGFVVRMVYWEATGFPCACN